MSLAAVPMQAAQVAQPWATAMAPMQDDVSMLSQQHAIRAAAATGRQQNMHHEPRRCKQRALKQFRLGGHETCSELYNLFEHGINGFPSWKQIKEDMQAQSIPLLSEDRTQYSN